MISNVCIKSFKNGLKIFLNEDCSFEEINNELSTKFLESQDFFKGGRIAVSFEGRLLSDSEEKILVKSIEENGKLTVLYIVGKDDKTKETFLKTVEKPVKDYSGLNVGKIITGSLKKGERIDTENSVVVLGDVEPGASIVSKGNIIVLGGIYGTAVIDPEQSPDKCFIAASDVSAELIKIGGYKYYSKERPKWVVKPKMVSKVAFVQNHQVTLEPISRDILKILSGKINQE